MRKKLITKMVVLGMAVIMSAMTVGASIQDEKDKKQELEDQLKNTEDYLASLEGLKSDSEAYIAAVDARITELANNIYSLQQQVEKKQKQIEKKEKQIAKKEKNIEKQYEDMAIRIQYMYENADAQAASLILESGDMEEFLNKANYIEEITQYDRDMLVELENSKAELEVKKVELQSQLNDLNATVQEAKEEQLAQETLLSNKQAEVDKYNEEIHGTTSQIADIEEDIAAQEALIKELEEIERQRQLQLQAQQNQLMYDGGKMSWPLIGYYSISSPMEYRIHPITGVYHLHSGIDIPAAMGTTIYAAYDGQVAWNNYNYSAGNWIGIDHGDGLYTIYMHMSGFLVKEGDYVKKGDPIGLVGSTGSSTGPHLHFSVRLNGEYVQPLFYVSPK